ncbi:unnamed protein product [Auanema sp. JU1783]|nr:unnamed protein product [Auanema sp. JU1783]
MSVDQTISELSQTLAQLGSLVGHINGQINGITSRINVTLDNFDLAVANIAKDAGSVTYQVGDSVSQVPNSWVFYVLFISLTAVFVLGAVLILLLLIVKCHAVYTIMRSKEGGDRALIIPRDDTSSTYDQKTPSVAITPYSHQLQYPSRTGGSVPHVGITMESEPRRPGIRRVSDQASAIEETPRPYQRRTDDINGAKYNLETGTTSYTRSLEV